MDVLDQSVSVLRASDRTVYGDRAAHVVRLLMRGAPPDRHCHNRQLEWWFAGIILSIGLWTIPFPAAFAVGRFAAIDNIISPPELTALLVFLGACRWIALYYNGRYPLLGPMVRVICALGSGWIFVQMAVALWINHLTNGLDPSPGIPSYFILTLAEARNAFRAASDAKFSRS